MDPLLLITLLFLAAFFYASVGHGGGSAYIALLTLVGISTLVVRPSALVLNIFVSGIAFYQYARQGNFRWNLFYPFIILSIPMAFLGSLITLDELIYKRILGICLLFAVARILIAHKKKDEVRHDSLPLGHGLWIGALLGFVSGIIGIGGGIILSPIILLLSWGNLKETAAVSALFILLNSIAGLIGLYGKVEIWNDNLWLWIPTVIIGGTIGAYFGARVAKLTVLKGLLALVLFVASFKLIFV